MLMTISMATQMLNVSTAKTNFSGITKKVLASRKPVIVRVPNGFVQIAPYELPEEVPAFPAGSLRLLPAELAMHNSVGETL